MSLSTGALHRRPESNSAPGPAHSMAGIVKNSMSSGAFQYEALTSSGSTSSAGINSSKSRLDDHAVQCSCGPFWGLRAKQLGGRNRSSKNSGLRGGNHETDETAAASFLFRLLASYGKLRESIKETSVNVGDLFGSQILFLMTASPIIPRAKSVSSRSTSRRLAMVPVTSSIPRSSSSLGQKSNDVGGESSKSMSRTRGGEFNADCRLDSSR